MGLSIHTACPVDVLFSHLHFEEGPKVWFLSPDINQQIEGSPRCKALHEQPAEGRLPELAGPGLRAAGAYRSPQLCSKSF